MQSCPKKTTRTLSLDDIRMKSSDLRDQKEIDAGGCGMVSLCVHKHYGLVVLKKVYTGPQRTEYNDSLLAEGKIMHRLHHPRVLKLLGLILEDGNYSLVMEYMKKGNLMCVLKTITVPLSVKGRFILEIIEGMSYLNDQGVIHRDLKPENILVDDEFHIKIADLGVASFNTWSKLTKEESKRQRKLNSKTGPKTNAGTLFYMAPEHLKSVNAKPTEKSDVYSFAIVVWVILVNKEPYEHAVNEDQVYYCITHGDRPKIDEVQEYWFPQVVKLMQHCWDELPEKRPTFIECEDTFRQFYLTHLEKAVETDVRTLKRDYPRQKDYVTRMESLQLDCDAEPPSSRTADLPRSLHSSQCIMMDNPLDESQFSASPNNEPVESEDINYNLERKLQDELSYHQKGSRLDQVEASDPVFDSEEKSRRVFNEGLKKPSAAFQPESYPRIPARNDYTPNTAPGYNPAFVREGFFSQPAFNNYNMPSTFDSAGLVETAQMREQRSVTTQAVSESTVPRTPIPESGLMGSLPLKPDYLLQNSTVPGMGTRYSSPFPRGHFGYSVHAPVQTMSPEEVSHRSISLMNTSGVQIGNNNVMSIESLPCNRFDSSAVDNTETYERLFECTTSVDDQHLNLVRDNLAKQWKTCARKLGLRNPDIDEIDHDYERDGLREKVYQMLQKWQMKEGSKGSTVGKLAKALYGCQRKDLLNALNVLLDS